MERIHGAVITGDLVASRKAKPSAVDNAMAILARESKTLSDRFGHNLKFTRFRGDGWQVVLHDQSKALDAAVYLLATMRRDGTPITTRIGIGLGTLENLDAPNLNAATGSAFAIAGSALDNMSKLRRIILAGDAITPMHDAVAALLENQIYQWTTNQAQAVAVMLDPTTKTQADAAQRLGITRQAVQLRLAGAGYNAVDDALRAVAQSLERPADD